jgi:hypothetical protein
MSNQNTPANVERPAEDGPAPARNPSPKDPRPWLGSATAEVLRWKRRALTAEGEVARLVAELEAASHPAGK